MRLARSLHRTMARLSCLLSMVLWLSLGSGCWGYFSLQVGDPCPTRDYRSSCQPAEQCSSLGQFIKSKRLSVDAILNCGYTTFGEKICCPLEDSPETTPASVARTTKAVAESTPSWLSLFKTNRDYVQRTVSKQLPVGRDLVIFPDTSTLAGATCQTPLYEGKCEAVSRCPSLEALQQQSRLRDEDIQTCRDGTLEEIICCPDNLPLQPRGQVSTASRVGEPAQPTPTTPASLSVDEEKEAIARAEQLMPHYKHLAALAFPNGAFDGHLHRCAGIALTPRLLLSAAHCRGASHAVFGVPDMRDVDVDDDYLADIARVTTFHDDLLLLQPQQSLTVDQSAAPNISLAPLCSQSELTRLQASGQLVATAWGKGNGSDCPLYELPMRLLPSEACKDVANASASHFCLAPVQLSSLSPSATSSCAPCPGVVGSVLHLLRPSGLRCVLAVATAPAAQCDAHALHYTSLLSAELLHFAEEWQRRKPT